MQYFIGLRGYGNSLPRVKLDGLTHGSDTSVCVGGPCNIGCSLPGSVTQSSELNHNEKIPRKKKERKKPQESLF